MICLFVGGPLDGELREVGETVEALRFANDYADSDHKPGTYHIANGIARHESVGEEEVARRVSQQAQKLKSIAAYCAQEATECDPFCCREYLNEIREMT